MAKGGFGYISRVLMTRKMIAKLNEKQMWKFVENVVTKAVQIQKPHRKTGTLARSIQGLKVSASHFRVVTGSSYGEAHEFGTRHSAAFPFITPAIVDVNKKMKSKGFYNL